MITEDGKAKIRDLITSEFTILKIGNGGDTTNPMASELDVPLASITASTTSSGASAVDYKGIFTGADISGQNIKEIGIFNASGVMLGRVNFDSLGPFTSSDTIEIIFTIEVE